MEAATLMLFWEMSVSAIAEMHKEQDTRLWRVLGHSVEKACQRELERGQKYPGGGERKEGSPVLRQRDKRAWRRFGADRMDLHDMSPFCPSGA